MEPVHVVNGPSTMSRPATSWPSPLKVRTSASPRCPELPVTKTLTGESIRMGHAESKTFDSRHSQISDAVIERQFTDSYLASLYDLSFPPKERDDFRFYLPMIMAARSVLDVGCRSEEHTSELQSRQYLVCRLL